MLISAMRKRSIGNGLTGNFSSEGCKAKSLNDTFSYLIEIRPRDVFCSASYYLQLLSAIESITLYCLKAMIRTFLLIKFLKFISLFRLLYFTLINSRDLRMVQSLYFDNIS